jgi:hypothetical protein
MKNTGIVVVTTRADDEAASIQVLLPNGRQLNVNIDYDGDEFSAMLFAGDRQLGGYHGKTRFLPKSSVIPAEVHSDDHKYEVQFDALKWFEQAEDAEILALAKCDWGGDYPADDVARFFTGRKYKDKGIVQLMDYCTRTPEMGFECHVEEKPARSWLTANRPGIRLPG